MIFYRFLLTLAAPVLLVLFSLRLLRRIETRIDLRERLGLDGPRQTPAGPVFWVHGASNGELTSARPFLETLLKREPRLRIVVTTNSTTGRDMVRRWALPRVGTRLAPLDYRLCLRAFLASHHPSTLILLEGDFWPNRIDMTANTGATLAMISARMSKGSFRKWSRWPRLTKSLMQRIDLLSAQDADAQAQYVSLGVSERAVAAPFNLKTTVSLAAPDAEELATFQSHYTRDDTLLAASTHPGEEEQILAAYCNAQHKRPDLRLILAPRHPKRSGEVAALIQAAGLPYTRRSQGEMPGPAPSVFLADTLGEMSLWYSLSGLCFVGGSLVEKGGHTPFEPAQFGCAILHGPDVSNAAEPYALLDRRGGALSVANAMDLGKTLRALDPEDVATLTTQANALLSTGKATPLAPLLQSLSDVTGLPSLRK